MKFLDEFKRTFAYCAPYKKLYIAGILSLVVVDMADVAAPYFINLGLEAADRTSADYKAPFFQSWFPASWFSEGPFYGMWFFGLIYVLVILLAGFFRYWMSMTFARASIGISTNLRNRVYSQVQRMPASFHDKTPIGDIMSLATNDLDALRMFWGFGMLMLFDVALYLFFTPVLMLSYSWKLTLMCLIPVPLIPLAISFVVKRIESRYEAVQEQFANVTSRSSESFSGARVVKSFASEEHEMRRFAELSREYRRLSMRLARIQTLEAPLIAILMGLMDFIVVMYGGWMVLHGEISWKVWVTFFFLLLRLSGPMVALGWVIAMYQRAAVSRRRIEELVDATPTVVDAQGATVPAKPQGRIELRNLIFSYFNERESVLRDVSLIIEAGTTVAVVGEVGAGKSSLLNLVPRLYDPPAGSVFIDGVDVRQLKLEWLRKNVAVVPQETFLFSEPIIANIGYGAAANPDPEKLKSYARLAQVEADILAFPKGYETMLGERGVNLSGGQKQRLAIARALACEPLILILDDCLSAVDSQTEEAILKGLKDQAGRRTCLVTSHRISGIKHADKIVVLEKGQVIEQGTHEQLLARGGWYADLYQKQQLEAEIERI